MKNTKNYSVIWVLLFIVIVMGVVKLTYKVPKEITMVPTVTPTAAATPTVAVTPTTKYERNYDDYPLWAKLPYSGQGFVVDRYTSPLTLTVKARGLDRTIVKKEVEKWIGENGIDPMTHKLVITN